MGSYAYSGPKTNGLFSVYIFDDAGNVEIRMSNEHGRAWRNNNPGDLIWNQDKRPDHRFAQNHGAIGRDYGGMAIFPDWETGLQAKNDLLLIPEYQNKTLYEAMEKYASKKDGNDPLTYAKHIAEVTSAAGEGAVTLNTPMKDITGSPARKKAMYDYIDKQEGAKNTGIVIKIDKDDYTFSAPEGWSPKERAKPEAGLQETENGFIPEIPSQGWGDVFSSNNANHEIADNLAESLVPRRSADVASWNPDGGLDEATATAWRNAAMRTRLVETIKESIDDQQENVVSTGHNPDEKSVYLVFESGKKLIFDETGNKTESTVGLNQSSLDTSGNNPVDPAGEYDYYDEDEYTYSSFYPGR